MLGRRQALAHKTWTADASAIEKEWVVDRGTHLIKKIYVQNISAPFVAATNLVRLYAEGEWLFSGDTQPIVGLFRKTDHANPLAGVEFSPLCLEFDQPLQWSKDYPIKTEFTNPNTNVIHVNLIGVLAKD